MNNQQIILIDGIKWLIVSAASGRRPVPLCPEHNLRMTPVVPYKGYSSAATQLHCAEGPHNIRIPREFSDEKQYVLDRIDAKVFANMPVLNLDDEAIPIAKESVKTINKKYFLTAQLMESKRGLQVVVYAGEKGKSQKAQIFVEPDIKRLAFDQKDLHPTDVFTELKVTFDDGSSHTMTKGDQKNAK